MNTLTFKRCSETRAILAFKQAHFSQSITSKIFKLSSSSFFFTICAWFRVDFQNAIKLWELVFHFQDTCVWTSCREFFQLWGEYMWSAVNVLTNSCNILDLIQKIIFQLNLSWNNAKLGYKFSRADISSVWDPWTRSFLKGALKQELVDDDRPDGGRGCVWILQRDIGQYC